MKRVASSLLGLLLLLSGCAQFGLAKSSKQEDAIRKVLNTQVAAWNRHDLDAFMAGYWNSPQLTFFSGGTVSQGWQAAIDRYKKNYQAPGKEMGQLEFQDLQIVTLGSKSAFVRGKFSLTMSDGKHPHGLFTLVFQQFPEGWRIIHDHSTSGQ